MDIVKRLRKHVNDRGGASLENGAWSMMLKGADEIERLREQAHYHYENGLKKDVEIEQLREALKELLNVIPTFPPDGNFLVGMHERYNKALIEARAALKEKQRLWNPWTNSKDMKAPEKMIDVMLANGEIITEFSGRELNWLDNMDPDKKIVAWRDVE